jgi:hypothetical protein
MKPTSNPRTLAWLLLAGLCAGCADAPVPAATETIAPAALVLSVRGEGELRSAKPVPLTVPGSNWSSRQVDWMLPEGSRVRKGELLARFSAPEGKQQLEQALIDLQRNALAKAAKEVDLEAGKGRVEVDLAHVQVQLGIAQRYANADLEAVARNDVLDAIEDAGFLASKQDTLEWQRGQSGARGAAELAVLGAQRSTHELNATARQSDLDALELRAPNDGVLLLSSNWSGDKPMVGSNLRAGFEFGSLPDASAMEVELDLPQIEAQSIQVGAVVELHPLGRPDQLIRGKLSWVASAAKVRGRDDPAKYLSMRAAIPAGDVARHGLVPGQRMAVEVFLLRAPEALSVPNVALREREGKHVVRVREDDGGFVERQVTLGVRGTARSQVLGGLAVGEQVMLAEARDSEALPSTKETAGDDGTAASEAATPEGAQR